MKELSIEEKAKAYDEAIEMAKELNSKVKGSIIGKNIEYIFPELAESEDERIRKRIIEWVNEIRKLNPTNADHNGDCSEAIAWLEKQGKQKPVIEMKSAEESLGISSDTYNKIVDECIYGEQKPADNQFTPEQAGVLDKHIDKFLNQKLAGNVEPKFKVGDWITNGIDFTFQIHSIEDNMYLRSDDYFIDIETADKNFRLWTIQDARDGDVLADDVGVILFRKIGNEKYKDVIDYHCIVFTRGEFKIQKGGCYWGYTQNCTLSPATKEQRDLLFQKMKESGYEWDAEKKELKKVEKKEELTDFENIVEEIADTSILNAYGVKELAKRLLSNAKKQLQEEFDKQLEQAYKNADKVQYERGYRKAIEDSWEYFSKGLPSECRDVVKQYFDKAMNEKLKELSQG